MDSSSMTDFKQPLPIDDVELNYLKDRLKDATALTVWGMTTEGKQEYDSEYPAIGKIEIYNGMNNGPTIKFTPSGWSRVYGQDYGYSLMDMSAITSNLDFENNVIYSGKPKTGKSISLTFNKPEELQLYLDAEGVEIHSIEGVDILQTVWGRMIGRFKKKCHLFAESLEMHPYYD